MGLASCHGRRRPARRRLRSKLNLGIRPDARWRRLPRRRDAEGTSCRSNPDQHIYCLMISNAFFSVFVYWSPSSFSIVKLWSSISHFPFPSPIIRANRLPSNFHLSRVHKRSGPTLPFPFPPTTTTFHSHRQVILATASPQIHYLY